MIEAKGVVRVSTPGTPVSVLTLLPANQRTQTHLIHAFFFQPLPTNSGFVYIGDDSTGEMDKSTLAHCYAWLPIPTTNSAPAFSGAHTIAPNGFTFNQFWVDADMAEDGVLVTVIVT